MKRKNLHIKNSYKVWSPSIMETRIMHCCLVQYDTTDYCKTLNRTKRGLVIEWWLHNIFYYITMPFIKTPKIKALNDRFKHVDLEEYTR